MSEPKTLTPEQPEAASCIESIVPEGMKLVPVEPTEEMIEAATQEFFGSSHDRRRRAYRAMLAAAPPAISASPLEEGRGETPWLDEFQKHALALPGIDLSLPFSVFKWAATLDAHAKGCIEDNGVRAVDAMCCIRHNLRKLLEVTQPREALASSPPVPGEPVPFAWHVNHPHFGSKIVTEKENADYYRARSEWTVTALYAAPAPSDGIAEALREARAALEPFGSRKLLAKIDSILSQSRTGEGCRG